jgi:hypothetical protein
MLLVILVDLDIGGIRMAKRSAKRSYFPVSIDIPSLSGGVGRASPAKRVPTESENIDNMLVTLEHSAEKRQGVVMIPWDSADDHVDINGRLSNGISDTIDDADAADKDLWFHWFLVSNVKKYLIAIDYKATASSQTLMWVFYIDSDGELNSQEIEDIDATTREYITHGSDTYTAKEALRAVAVGSSILVLNTKVKAGFTSSSEIIGEDGTIQSTNYLRNMDGDIHEGQLTDDKGEEIKYSTSITVDLESEAEVWTEHSQYISGDTAYDTNSRLSDVTSYTDNSDPFGDNPSGHGRYDYLQYNIFKVNDKAGSIVGPDGSGVPVRRPSAGISKAALNFRSSSDFPESSVVEAMWTSGTESTRAENSWQFQNNHSLDGITAGTSIISTGIRSNIDNKGSQFPHWTLDQPYETMDQSRDSSPKVVFTDAYKYNSMADDVADGIVPGVKVTTGSSYSGPAWSPGDIIDNGYHIHIHIDEIVSIGVLVKHIVRVVNNLSDMGIVHCTAVANSSVTGVEFTSHFYVNQWESTTKEVDGETVPNVTDYMEANNYFYPDQDKRFLGQAVKALTDLKFPPSTADLSAFNGGDAVERVLRLLYPDLGHVDVGEGGEETATGLGKIYYLSQQYLGLSEGYYRVKDTETQPYLHKIRTPHEMSIIDKRRMPRQIALDEDLGKWTMREVEWDPRDSGSIKSNPGPSIFHDGDGNAIQRAISAISFYRGRLFLASEDILVSSRIGNWDNFFVNNPDNLTVADPIDLRVSSNAYTPITYLQPYRNFLFLATDGDTQYELIGSENQISPLTAEIAPTSFYNMTLDVEPVLLNDSLFFLSENKLYIYFGEQTESNQNAVEISVNCPDYLPTNYREIATSPSLNSLFVLDGDNTNTVYCYTNRLSGTEIAQNSFFRFIFPATWNIHSMKAIGEYLYLVWEEEIENSNGTGTWTSVNIGKLHLKNEDLTIPRMDSLIKISSSDIVAGPTVSGEGSNQVTTVWVKSPTVDIDTIVLWHNDTQGDGTPGADATRGDRLTATAAVDNTYASQGAVALTVTGDYTGATKLESTDGFYIGKKFNMTVELSPQFYRDQNLAVQNGSLNLRLGMFRFRNTGDFQVSVVRKSRAANISSFTIDIADQHSKRLTYTPYDEFGVFKVPILSFSNDAVIKIISDSVHPVAISDVEFSAKFKYKMTSLGTM